MPAGKSLVRRSVGNGGRTRPAARPSKKVADAPEKTRIAFSGADDAPEYYTNHVEVSHGVHEYEILFGKIPTRLTEVTKQEAKKSGVLYAEALVKLFIPPSLMDDLIKVLKIQQGKHDETVALVKAAKEASNE